MKAYIGIDPGKTGAIAVVTGAEAEVYDWPGDEVCLARLLALIDLDYNVVRVRIEKQGARPGQGVCSMFSIGVNYGMLLAACASRSWSVEIISTRKWREGRGYPQKSARVPRNIYTRRLKEHSLTTAKRFFPKLADQLSRQKDHGRAEALLIAYSAMESAK